mgnify:FL=1
MTYSVNNIFGPTIQGEGDLQGTPCVFLRFSGCNLWSGLEKDRHMAVCKICDTNFAKGVEMSANEIVGTFKTYIGEAEWIVISGGEPLLQLDDELLDLLHADDWLINVETNGTFNITNRDVEHISFSPKTSRNQIKLERCDSLKILWPDYEHLIKEYADYPARHKFLQPTDHGDGFDAKVLDKLYVRHV